jgi:hypothetical protein
MCHLGPSTLKCTGGPLIANDLKWKELLLNVLDLLKNYNFGIGHVSLRDFLEIKIILGENLSS